MILTMMALVLITGLASTVAVLTIDNLRSSWRAQQAGSAVNAADAGVAQAMTYLRSSGVRDLRCSPSCTTNSWGNSTSPTQVELPNGESYRVWIEPVSAYPANDPGLYRIHSSGGGGASATRTVLADVNVTTTQVPRGIFAHTISGGGSASVTRQSVFSTGCVWERDKIAMEPGEIDLAYGIPIGVHTSDYITTAHGSGQHCSETESGLIHATRSGSTVTRVPCSIDPKFRYDQDRMGGSLADTACSSVQTDYPTYYGPRNLDAQADLDVEGSYVKDDATLARLFNLRDPALSPTQLDQLRSIARAQNNYWTSSTVWSTPDEANAVMFFDLTKGTDLGGTVDLNKINDTAFGREAGLLDTDPRCTSRSLLIVVDGGNVKINSDQRLYASLFLTSSAPYGQVVKANGTAEFIGTIYADKVNLVGTFDASMDKCFLANTSPALLDFRVGSYREDDRGLS
jgi:hypothetical protein